MKRLSECEKGYRRWISPSNTKLPNKAMPGPVSDSYDPEFGTGANAHDVRTALTEVRDVIGKTLPEQLMAIVEIAQGGHGKKVSVKLSEKQRRLIRFALNRVVDEI